MNRTSIAEESWFNDIQYGNKGAVLFIIAYIGFYGLCIICIFGQQLKDTQRQRQELPAYFLKTLWDVPNKDKLYQELADVEYLKRIFHAYFVDHETCLSLRSDDLQAIVDKRAHACASRYRQKLRRLHRSHTDYNLDTVQRSIHIKTQKQVTKSSISIHTSINTTTIDCMNKEDNKKPMLAISVV